MAGTSTTMSVWSAGAAYTAALTTACRVDGSVSVISSDRARVSSRTSGSILSASRLSCEAASRAMQLCRSAGVSVVVVPVFVAESAARAEAAGRTIPRIAVLLVSDPDDPETPDYQAQYARFLTSVAPCEPVVTAIGPDEVFAASVLTDVDGLLVGGGVTPWYLDAVDPLVEEIRLLVTDGLPYLGYSAGAMIAADRAIIGGWRINGVEVCPEDTGEDLDDVTVAEGLGLVDLAVDVHAAHLQVAADVGAALAAGVAVAAGGDLIDDDAVAHLHAGHALADLLNDAHVLVADDAGIGGSGIGAMVDAHVGAADTGSDHADQNIVFLVDLRLLEINDLQFIRFNDLNALHKIFLLKSDNGLKDFDDLSARWADGSGPC